MTYNGNGSTGGTVPTDANNYQQGDSVTVLGNMGNLVKTQDGISLLFTGWNTATDGSGTSYKEADTFNMGNANVTLYAQWSVLRGTGPAGGLIFYDKGIVSEGWRYLEAAPNDQTSRAWGTYGHSVSGADGIEIGTGQQNTLDTIAGDTLANKAADECANYSIVNGGVTYNDWFLPSKDELSQMYENLKSEGVGGFTTWYWSSSEVGSGSAWCRDFDIGSQSGGAKDNTGRVRAVRAFRSIAPTYLVNYNANGATSGTAPSDGVHYEIGDTVTVLHNTGTLVKTGYTFDGWNTAVDGNGTDLAEGSTFDMGSSDVTLYAKWTTYSLRDIGPAGGYIFYDKGSYSGSPSWRYLEAAPSDHSTRIEWITGGSTQTTLNGNTSTELGTGQANTNAMKAQTDYTGGAAKVCDDYSVTVGSITYNDWFLPSKDELNKMWVNLKKGTDENGATYEPVDSFADYYYWSSSEYDAYTAWIQDFRDGTQYGGSTKLNTFRVRAVWAF